MAQNKCAMIVQFKCDYCYFVSFLIKIFMLITQNRCTANHEKRPWWIKTWNMCFNNFIFSICM